MKKFSLFVLVLFVFASLPVIGWAASPWTLKTTNHDKMVGKLGFGVKNLLLGWTEILKEPVHHYQKAEHNRFGAGLIGLGEGLFNGVADTIGGVLHLVTFPLTSLDVPLPHDGTQCPLGGHCPLKKA